jgi:hypothetical protein
VREHLQALVTALTPVAPTALGESEETSLPWIVVEVVGMDEDGDLPSCGLREDVDITVRVKSVAARPLGAVHVSDQARAALQPGDSPTRLPLPGRSAVVWRERHEADFVDRDVTLAGGIHPAVSVDTYRLRSTPL